MVQLPHESHQYLASGFVLGLAIHANALLNVAERAEDVEQEKRMTPEIIQDIDTGRCYNLRRAVLLRLE